MITNQMLASGPINISALIASAAGPSELARGLSVPPTETYYFSLVPDGNGGVTAIYDGGQAARQAQQTLAASSQSNSDPSNHFATISFWPSGAGHLGHIGVGVDTDDTQGFATASHQSPIGFVLGFIFAGRVQDDVAAHTRSGEVATHFTLHIPVSAGAAQSMRQAINDRAAHPGLYNLYFRNCAGFVETVLHAGGVKGVPHSEIFFPPVLYGMLWYVNTWR